MSIIYLRKKMLEIDFKLELLNRTFLSRNTQIDKPSLSLLVVDVLLYETLSFSIDA